MPDNIVRKDYPANSIKSKGPSDDDRLPQKKTQKVITGQIVKKKKSWFDSFGEVFFGDDSQSVGTYILYDVLIPAAKNTISEMVSGGIEMLLFGDRRSDRTRREKGKSYVSYTSYSQPQRPAAPVRNAELAQRSRQRFDDILMESRIDAEEVLSGLVEIIEMYGQATVSDFYDLVGMESTFADNKYGWTNLSRATVNRVRDGYIVVLPKPLELA